MFLFLHIEIGPFALIFFSDFFYLNIPFNLLKESFYFDNNGKTFFNLNDSLFELLKVKNLAFFSTKKNVSYLRFKITIKNSLDYFFKTKYILNKK